VSFLDRMSRAYRRYRRRALTGGPADGNPLMTQAWEEQQFRYYATPQPYAHPLSLAGGNLTGETWEMRQAYREWAIREPAVKASLLTKCLAVAQLEPQVIAADKSDPGDRAAAEWVKHAIEQSDEGFPGLIQNLVLPACIDGFSVVEPVWGHMPDHDRRYPGWWRPKSYASIDTHYLRFRLDVHRQVTAVQSMSGAMGGSPLDPADFIVFTHLKLFENPFGFSDLRSVVRAAKLIESAIRLRHILLTNFSGPYLVAKAKDPAARNKMMSLMADARANGFIVIPDGADLEVFNLATSAPDQFRASIEDYRQEIVTGIQGAYLQLLEGSTPGGRGDTEVHRGVAELFVWWLATWVSQVITRQHFPDLIRHHFGNNVGCPKLILGGIDEAAINAKLDRFTKGQSLGLTLSKSQAMEVGGFESPKDEADALTPPTSTADAPGGGNPDDPFGGLFAHGGQKGGTPAAAGTFRESDYRDLFG
jgi:hypothetical protein